MDLFRTERRRLARWLSFALLFTLCFELSATNARAQTASPPPPETPSPAPPVPTALPGTPPPAAAPSTTPPPTTPPPTTTPDATPPAATPAPAAAPTPPPPPSPPTKEQLAEAKKFFDNGKKLEKEQLYQEALASFLEANRIAPRLSIQNELARTYRFMKDMASAYDAYDTMLQKYADQMKAAQKKDAESAMTELEVLTGVVTVGVQEPGAHVLVDQKEVGQTPIAKPVRLNIGSHQLTITKEGFDTLTQAIDIHGHDNVPVNGPLVKTVTTGHVTVDVKQTTPPDPTVLLYVDSADAGPPPYAADLDPGTHTLEAKGDKAVAAPKQINVEKKGTYNEVLELHIKAGTIVVNVDVADTEISIDGKVAARGVYEGPLDAGTHALTVTKQGYVQYKKDLVIDDGQRVVENVALQKEVEAAPGPAAPPPPKYNGVYSQFNLMALFETGNPTNDVAQGIGYAQGTPISTSGVAGGALNLKVGYSFGFIGIEGSLLFGYDHSESVAQMQANQATVTHPNPQGLDGTPRNEDYTFHRLGGSFTLGVRVMPKMRVFRPTLALGGGVSAKGMFYQRGISGLSSNNIGGQLGQAEQTASSLQNILPSSPTFYVVPNLSLEGGILLGSTPGTKFYLAGVLLVDFGSTGSAPMSPGSTNNQAVPGVQTLHGVNGTDVFLGPVIGMQFGE
jgi:hypothetical protein